MGTTFSSSGLFTKATDQAMSKANITRGNLIHIDATSKTTFWHSQINLYNTVFDSTLSLGNMELAISGKNWKALNEIFQTSSPMAE